MDKKHKVNLYGLEKFGLTLKSLKTLGKRPVTLRASFRHINESKLFSLVPSERKKKIEEWYDKIYLSVQKKLPDIKIQPTSLLKKNEAPRTIRITLRANQVYIILNTSYFQFISVEKVSGIQRKKIPVTKKDDWFAIKARVVIQIEGQTKGYQMYDDRIVLIKAQTANKAQTKLKLLLKKEGAPYLNSDGYMVSWVFESILDGYHLIDEEINEGTEVFSVLKNRKMKPEYQWDPLIQKTK